MSTLSAEEEKWLSENDPEYSTYANKQSENKGLSAEEEKWLSENDPEYSTYAKPKEEPGRWGAAFGRAKHGAVEALHGVGLGVSSMFDSDENVQKQMEAQKALQKEVVPGPKSMTAEDIVSTYKNNGILAAASEVPSYMGEKLAESSVESAVPLAAMGIAGLASAPLAIPVGIATAVLQQFGHMMGRQAETKVAAGELDPSSAVMAAIPAGALDFFADKFTLGIGGGAAAKSAIKEAAAQEIQKRLVPEIVKRVGAGAARGLVTEPPTEIAQQALERGQADLPLWDEAAKREYSEAGWAAAGAGALGGGAFSTLQRSPEEEFTPPPATEEQPAATTEEQPTTPPKPGTSVEELLAGLKRPEVSGSVTTPQAVVPTAEYNPDTSPDVSIMQEDGTTITSRELYDEEIAVHGDKEIAAERVAEAIRRSNLFNRAKNPSSVNVAETKAGVIKEAPPLSEEAKNIEPDEQDEELNSIAKTPVAEKVKEVKAPVAEEVKAPVAEEVKAPVAEEVKTPVAEEVKAPIAEEVKTPIAEEVKTPVAEEVKTPVAEEVKALSTAQKKTLTNQIRNFEKPSYNKNALMKVAKSHGVWMDGASDANLVTKLKGVLEGTIVSDKLDAGANYIRYEKGYKPTTEPSAENFLNQIHVTNAPAPKTTEKGIEHAGAAEAFDMFDKTDYENVIEPKIREKLEARQIKENEDRATKRDKIVAEKEAADRGEVGKRWSEERYTEALSRVKPVKYSMENVKEFLKPSELLEIYKDSIKDIPHDTKRRRIAAENRAAFVATLTPEQAAQVQKYTDKVFAAEVNSAVYKRKKEHTEKPSKAKKVEGTTEKEIIKSADELVQEQASIAEKKKNASKAKEQLEKDLADTKGEIDYEGEEDTDTSKAEEQLEKDLADTKGEIDYEGEEDTDTSKAEEELSKQLPLKERTKTGDGKSDAVLAMEEEIASGDATRASLLATLEAFGEPGNISRVVARNLRLLIKDIKNMEPVTVKFGFVEDGHNAKFDPNTNTITIKGNRASGYTGVRSLDEVVLHELTHSLIDHVLVNEKAYVASIKDAPKKARVVAGLARLKTLHKQVTSKESEIGKNFEIGELKEFIAETISNPSLQLALGDMPYVGTKSALGKVKTFFNEVVNAIADVLGFKNKDEGTHLKVALDDILNLISSPSETIKGSEVSYVLQAPPHVSTKGSIFHGVGGATPTVNASNAGFLGNSLDTSIRTWRRLVKTFQNSTSESKRWQNTNDLAGKITKDNAINDEVTLGQERANLAQKEHVAPLITKLNDEIVTLTKALKLKSATDAAQVASNIRTALGGQERRVTKYELTKSLIDKKAEDYRHQILELKNDPRISEADAVKLRKELSWLVANFADTTDPRDIISDSKYNAVGMTYDEEQDVIKQYQDLANTNPAAKAALDKIVGRGGVLEQLSDTTRKMDEKSGYWSKPVSNIVAFYGWEHYSPLKTTAHFKVDTMFDLDQIISGKEYQQLPRAWSGEISDSENCLIQSITDADRATRRIGTAPVSRAVIAAKKDGLINAKITNVPFVDRDKLVQLSKDVKDRTMLHYKKDGSVDVIEFAPTEIDLLNGIRKQYKPTSKAVDVLSSWTSFMAQMHTRYNVNFAPMNFARDILTNSWSIGAEEGIGKTANVITSIAKDVLINRGIATGWKMANMYEHNKIAELRNIAINGKDPFAVAMAQYILAGGKVTHMASITNKSSHEKVRKLGKNTTLVDTREGVDKIITTWNEMFELSSRTSAFKMYRDMYTKDNMAKGMDREAARNAAIEKAAAKTKNLANFEQVGTHGKEMGAIFMFFRPSATGAVRAVEALSPAVISLATSIRNLDNAGAFAYDVDPTTHKRIYKDPQAIATYKKNYKVRQQHAQVMSASLFGMGMAVYSMAKGISDDDDEGRNKVANDNPSQWNKFARFIVGGEIRQIPWGFGLGAFAAAGAQMAMAAEGDIPLGEAIKNITTQISLDSFIPVPVSRMDYSEEPLKMPLDSITPSIFRPLMEFAFNKNGLGQNINSTSPGGVSSHAYSGGEKIPEIYKTTARWFSDVTNEGINISPSTLHFFANNYLDGITRLAETAYSWGQITSGGKEFNMKTDAPFIGSFYGAESNIDARQFGKIETKIDDIKRDLKTVANNPKEHDEYVDANPMAHSVVAVYDKYNGALNKLYRVAKMYRENPDYTQSERESYVKPIIVQQNIIKQQAIETFKYLGVLPD